MVLKHPIEKVSNEHYLQHFQRVLNEQFIGRVICFQQKIEENISKISKQKMQEKNIVKEKMVARALASQFSKVFKQTVEIAASLATLDFWNCFEFVEI